MPPKVKITRQDILKTALALLKTDGNGAINARNLAAALSCSTQPIFSNFASMEELDEAIKQEAYTRYLSFIQSEIESEKYPKYKAFGMAYIRFAKEEKELFKLLFMCEREDKDLSPSADFKASVDMLMEQNGITREKAELMHLEMWSCTHGIGAMLATSFLSPDEELISRILTDIYQGLRARIITEEVYDACH